MGTLTTAGAVSTRREHSQTRSLFAGLASVLLASVVVLIGTVPAHADSVRDSEWWFHLLHLDQAQAISQGKGVKVGVIDTGVDSSHPDLTGTVSRGTDAWNHWKGNGQHPDEGHGTAMASLIAGHGHGSGAGIVGVAPEAKLFSVDVFRPNAKYLTYDAVGYGIRWVVDRGATVINLSVGGGISAIDRKGIEYALRKNVVVVASAGNTTQDDYILSGYADVDGVVAVSSVDQKGKFSHTSTSDARVVVSAPGVDMNSAWLHHGYDSGTGTSNATAIVSGVAALVRSKYPSLSQQQVVKLLESTATDKGPKGRDDKYGFGVVNPVRALKEGAKMAASPSPGAADAGHSSSGASHPAAAARSDDGRSVLTAVVIAGVALALALGGAGVVVAVRQQRRNRSRGSPTWPGPPAP